MESGPQLVLQIYIFVVIRAANGNNNKEGLTDNEQTALSDTSTTIVKGNNYNASMSRKLESNNSHVDDVTHSKAADWLLLVTMVTSLLSISSGAVSTTIQVTDFSNIKRYKKRLMFCGGVLLILWNMLCISSRVLAMALFAAQRDYKYYLIVVVIARIFITAGMYKSCVTFTDDNQRETKFDQWQAKTLDQMLEMLDKSDQEEVLTENQIREETISERRKREANAFIFKSICILSSVFNILPIGCRYFIRWYVLYWASMMLENGAFAFVWYNTCVDLHDMTSVWYRRQVLTYLILSYIFSVGTLPLICLGFQTFKDKEDIDVMSARH